MSSLKHKIKTAYIFKISIYERTIIIFSWYWFCIGHWISKYNIQNALQKKKLYREFSRFWNKFKLEITELDVNELVFPQERKLPGSFDDGELPYDHQTVKDMNYFFYFEAHDKIIYQMIFERNHLVAVRGHIHQDVPTRVRQRGELKWASQLKSPDQQISSTKGLL